jgi:hypothetical protein
MYVAKIHQSFGTKNAPVVLDEQISLASTALVFGSFPSFTITYFISTGKNLGTMAHA